MPELDLKKIPAGPPATTDDGDPIPCPRCGRIYERAPAPGVMAHPTGHPVLCPPLDGSPIRDARERKKTRRGKS